MVEVILEDLHNHLKTGGWPGKVNANRVVDKASHVLGEGGVLGITNYLPVKRYEDFVNSVRYDKIDLGNAVYLSQPKLIVIKTSEIMTQLPNGQAEILAVGLDKDKNPEHRRSLGDTLKEVRDL